MSEGSLIKDLYLDLLKKCLTDSIHKETYAATLKKSGDGKMIQPAESPQFTVEMRRLTERELHAREVGLDWPAMGETMVGMKRLDNVQACVEDVLTNNIPGDIIEAGVWRGGVAILMRAILKVNGVIDRTVWAADSFSGLPAPNANNFPADASSQLHNMDFLAVSLEEVKANFERYGMLDEQVKFAKGWFRDTLPTLHDKQWAIVRLDGDMYESTMDGLTNLYPNLSVGGYIIIDDFGALTACRQAVKDYRAQHGIEDPIQSADWTGCYWQKSG